MQMHFFAIPTLDSQVAQDELNRFCAGHRVVAVDRQFVSAGRDSHWAVCLTVAPGPGPLPESAKAGAARGAKSASAARVDYRQVLSESDFARFAVLRAWRKAVAEHEGVPVYAVFTNEQLAEIVQRRVTTRAELAAIEGVGPARLERYGAAVLARLGAAPPESEVG